MFGGTEILHAARDMGWEMLSVLFFVCFSSVMLLKGRVCANDFAIEAFECRNRFDVLDREGMCIVVVHHICFITRWCHHIML